MWEYLHGCLPWQYGAFPGRTQTTALPSYWPWFSCNVAKLWRRSRLSGSCILAWFVVSTTQVRMRSKIMSWFHLLRLPVARSQKSSPCPPVCSTHSSPHRWWPTSYRSILSHQRWGLWGMLPYYFSSSPLRTCSQCKWCCKSRRDTSRAAEGPGPARGLASSQCGQNPGWPTWRSCSTNRSPNPPLTPRAGSRWKRRTK